MSLTRLLVRPHLLQPSDVSTVRHQRCTLQMHANRYGITRHIVNNGGYGLPISNHRGCPSVVAGRSKTRVQISPLMSTVATWLQLKHPVPDRVCNFWHPGTLTLSPERQSARMSKITNPVWHRMLYSCTYMATVGVKWIYKSIVVYCNERIFIPV